MASLSPAVSAFERSHAMLPCHQQQVRLMQRHGIELGKREHKRYAASRSAMRARIQASISLSTHATRFAPMVTGFGNSPARIFA